MTFLFKLYKHSHVDSLNNQIHQSLLRLVAFINLIIVT